MAVIQTEGSSRVAPAAATRREAPREDRSAGNGPARNEKAPPNRVNRAEVDAKG